VMALVAEWKKLGLDVNFADLAKTPTLNAWWDLLAQRQAA
jgi:bifunctional isochorismate lyase/aryl carrier protein